MGFDAAKKLDVLKKEAQALVDQIRAQLTAYLESDADDPICSVFKNIVANVTCHRTADQFIESAKKRKVLGKPPISKEKYSIGDELIWETLVGCVKNDLIIVSRDRTFLNNIPILKEEYRSRTGRELTITDSVTDALGKVGEMSEALADAEVAIAERSWHEERIRRSNEIAEYERAARQIDPSIGSFGAAGQYSGHRIRTSLQRYRAAIGNADNLTEDQKRLLTRVDDMIARWEGWPDNNAETLAILKAIKVLAQSLGKT
jgi:hypothetical protein